jgi:nucleoside-diphosphate-sugar epimerase
VKAEMALQQMAEPQKFFPIIFRQATVVGYSPRMRFDLVLNTMVRDAFAEKKIKAVDCYRPLIDVNDVAFCHTIMTDLTIYRLSMFDWSPTTQTKFQIMNVKKKNYRIADLGRELQAILLKDGIKVDLELIDKDSADHRSYQISANKARDVFGFTPLIGTDQSAPKMWDVLKHKKIEDPFDRKYYNLKVMEKYAKHG